MSWCWGVFELPRQPPRGCRHTRRHPREVFRHRLWVPTGAQRQLQQLEQGLCWKRASRRRRRKAEEHYGGLDCSLSFKVCLVRNIGCELSLINKAWIDVKIVDWDIVRGSCTNWVRDRLSPPIAPYHHSIPILCFAFLPFKKLSHSTTILFRAKGSIAQNSKTAQTRNPPGFQLALLALALIVRRLIAARELAPQPTPATPRAMPGQMPERDNLAMAMLQSGNGNDGNAARGNGSSSGERVSMSCRQEPAWPASA